MLRCFISRKSVFTKSIGRSRLWIELPQNGVGKPLEAIRIIPSNKCKMYLKENNGSEEPFGLTTTRFKCTQRYHSKKSPKMIRYVFGDVRNLYLISCGLQKMKSVLSGVRSFFKLLLTGLNPHIQKIVSLLFTMILNKRKNLSCVFLLLRGHNFLSVKGCNR